MNESKKEEEVEMSKGTMRKRKATTKMRLRGCLAILRRKIEKTKDDSHSKPRRVAPESTETNPEEKLMKMVVTRGRCHPHRIFTCLLRPAKMIGMSTSGPISTFVIGARYV